MKLKLVLVTFAMFGIMLMTAPISKAENKASKVLMIADFEKEDVLKQIIIGKGISVRLTDKDVVSGKRALEVRIKAFSKHKNRWPLIALGPAYIKSPIDCGNYTKISVTVRNVTKGLAKVLVYFTSLPYNDHGKNMEGDSFMIPGGTSMKCDVSTSIFQRKMNDPSSIRYIQFRFPANELDAVYRIDAIRAIYNPAEGSPVERMLNDVKSASRQIASIKQKIDWDTVPEKVKKELLPKVPEFTREAKRILTASRTGLKKGLRGKYNPLKESLDMITRYLGKFVLADKRDFYLWEISPYINIYRDEFPDIASPKLEKIDVKMAVDEFRDKVLMVSSCGKDVKIKVEVKTSKGLPSKAVSIRESLYFKVGKDDLGDVLYDLEGPLVVPKGESRQLWLRFDTRHSGLKPGNYSFTVVLHDLESGSRRTIPGNLTVWNFKLPSYDTIPNNAYVEFDNSEMGGRKILAKSVKHMKMYGINMFSLYPQFLPWPVSVDKNLKIVKFDTSRLEQQILPVIKAWKAAPGNEKLRFIFSLSGMPDRLLKRKDIKYPSKEWKKVFGQWLVLLKENLRKSGLADDDWMFFLADESNASVLVNYELPQAELIKSIDPNIKITCNSAAIIEDKATSFRFYRAFDYVFGKLSDIERYPHLADWVKQGGKPPSFWIYKCSSMLGRFKNFYDYYRVYGWKNYKYGNVGTGLWTYCAQSASPWGKSKMGQRAKHYCLVFKHKDKNDVVHSRRYEFYRQGIDDYRYLITLKKLASKKGPKAEEAAEKLINQAIEDIVSDIRDTTRCDKWRIRIAKEILKIKGMI